MKMTDKVRRLLAKGVSTAEIAKKLKIRPAYVHTVKWLDKKKKKTQPERSHDPKVVEAEKDYLRSIKQAMDTIQKKPKKLFVQPQHKYAAMKILADNDLVNNPPHYKTGGIDFLDYAEAKGLTENAYLFNVVKYVSRAGKKLGVDPIQDLEKAEFYIKREIDRRKSA